MLPKPEGIPKRLELREAGNPIKEKRGGSPQHGGGEIQESICETDLEGDQLQLKQVRNLWAMFVIQKEIDRIPN